MTVWSTDLMRITMIDGLSTLYSCMPQWHIHIQAVIKGSVTENCSMLCWDVLMPYMGGSFE